MSEKILENKIGEKFGFGLFIVFLAMSVSLFAFITEENKITGLATYSPEDNVNVIYNLMDFDDVKSLSTLAAGNYYIDENGIVYWLDDESRPAIAHLSIVEEFQKNRNIYIDDSGRIGYVLSEVSISEQ